jgi:formylglycine-generating enzyme required for sulfatase activity
MAGMMAPISLATLLVSVALSPAWPQAQTDAQLKQAGVCARCHVISVVEWGISRHMKVGTDCIACHGSSVGHVRDERNNIKPDRIPRGEAAAALCATCHSSGCPKTKENSSCQTCHHVHALVDPKKPPSARNEQFEQLTVKWQSAARHVAEGERLAALEQWEIAREEFKAALTEQPENRVAANRVKLCDRRLGLALPGFEVIGEDRDAATGLPREVRIARLGIAMVLVPGGQADMGSDRFAAARPVHTVSVAPFYLGKFEVTQSEWKSLMGTNPSANQGDRMPVEQISWEDAQAFIRKLNERVPGAGFRLPAEAEWEFAARAGEPVSGESLANVALFSRSDSAPAPLAVGSKQPNKLGLFDMQGNVWEWCSSLYSPYPYDASDGRESPDVPGLRVLRGGGFADTADLLDPANRHGERTGRRLRWNGMRVARSVPEE